MNEQIDEILDDQAVTPISISEAFYLLKNISEKKKNTQQKNRQLTLAFEKFYEYIQQFNKYKDKKSIEVIREKLDGFNLKTYQQALIWNLVPTSEDEARALVSEMDVFDNQTIREMIEVLKQYKK